MHVVIAAFVHFFGKITSLVIQCFMIIVRGSELVNVEMDMIFFPIIQDFMSKILSNQNLLNIALVKVSIFKLVNFLFYSCQQLQRYFEASKHVLFNPY